MNNASLLVLDQWAGTGITAGTSKNWLYSGLGQRFRTKVVNADGWKARRARQVSCLWRALCANPRAWREGYHEELEWEAKRPRAFQMRTRRFAQALGRVEESFHVVLQIGCLFGPVCLPGALHASYHDQTLAMVLRAWPRWFPPDFPKYQERMLESERKTLCSRHVILTYSEAAKRSMVQDYGIEAGKVHVAPSACKLAFPPRSEFERSRRERLVFASTDFVRKGGDLLLNAFATMRKHRPSLELVLVGGRTKTALPEGARHLGMLSHEALKNLFLDSALILHPARHDAFPNVLKEAQACCLPAVASDSAGIPEIVLHGRNGLILDNLSPETLAQTVLNLLDTPERLASMRLACLEDRERYHPVACADRIGSILSSALANGNFA